MNNNYCQKDKTYCKINQQNYDLIPYDSSLNPQNLQLYQFQLINDNYQLDESITSFPPNTIPSYVAVPSDNYFWHFSYGSNSIRKLAKDLKLNSAALFHTARPGILYNYRRGFFGSSLSWKGAVATIYPQPGSRVYGLLLRIPISKKAKLEINEGVLVKKYKVVNLDVKDQKTGKIYNAVTYIGLLKRNNQYRPFVKINPCYLTYIAEMMNNRRRIIKYKDGKLNQAALLEQNDQEEYVIDINIFFGNNTPGIAQELGIVKLKLTDGQFKFQGENNYVNWNLVSFNSQNQPNCTQYPIR